MIASERLEGSKPGEFFEQDYPIPTALSAGKTSIRVRFEPETGVSAGPAFGIRLFSASPASP